MGPHEVVTVIGSESASRIQMTQRGAFLAQRGFYELIEGP